MICIIGSETTENYGLLEDLMQSPDYRIVYTRPPYLFGTIAWKILRRIRTYLRRVKEFHMRWEKTVLRDLDRIDRIIVVDTALRWLELNFLGKCREQKPDLQIDCLLLNSTKSMAFSEIKIHSKFQSFNWNTVLTFDPIDAETYKWVYTGLHYYSKRSLPGTPKLNSDLFFAGSIMGQRGKTLLHLLDRFNEHDVNCCFICPSPSRRQYYSRQPKGLRMIRRRISYKQVLKWTMRSNCILEVLQDGQRGSSLRYMEAVCYNKKLLTTNAEIKNYPFYDERYMKVFSTESEIDFDWVKKSEKIDYGYTNEFSPTGLIHALYPED